MKNKQTSPYGVYLEHLQKGVLAYQYSTEAKKAIFYPREICPETGLDCLEWRISKGLGTVYSTSAVHPRDGSTYNVSLIDCDEGFRLMSRVQDIAPEHVTIGMRVQFKTHTPSGDDPYPVFVPVA